VPVLEDDAYGELWSQGEGPAPLMALDRGGVALHLGTFSKTIAPGLRVGWLAGPAPVLARLALIKQILDLNTGALPQMALAAFLQGDRYDRHLAQIRGIHAARRAAMLTALERARDLIDAISYGAAGGFYLWCRLRQGYSAQLLTAAAARNGVAVLPGDAFYPPFSLGTDDGRDQIRLSVAGVAPAQIGAGVERLLRAAAALAPRREGHSGMGLRPVG
jgi:DNA-binding transcriptional MocR family regulator